MINENKDRPGRSGADNTIFTRTDRGRAPTRSEFCRKEWCLMSTYEWRYSMSKEKTKEELISHKSSAIEKLNAYLESLILSDNPKLRSKADKIDYWLEDWTTFLDFESHFSPMSLRRYKRGEIIKVHLGFNVGSEEGGLHYAVVIDKNNAKSSPVVTIVPLTSVKAHTDLSKLKSGSVFLGNELFTNLNSKISATHKRLDKELSLMKFIVNNKNISSTEYASLPCRIKKAEDELNLLERMRKEVIRMKIGSIALVNQITTISKIRIYDPKTDHDILSNIKLSNEKLDLIDNEIRQRFTNI